MSGPLANPRSRYLAIATGAGLALGWLPVLIHGPIPERFEPHGLRGDLAVWAWYWSRMSIGLFVGVTVWPARAWLRGAAVGALVMVPAGFFSLATPNCGFG